LFEVGFTAEAASSMLRKVVRTAMHGGVHGGARKAELRYNLRVASKSMRFHRL